MTLFGYPIETVYFTVILVVGIIILIDVLTALIFSVGIISFVLDLLPIPGSVLLYFLGFASVTGYLGERYTSFSSVTILIAAIIIGIIFSSILYFGIFLPLSRTSDSIAYATKDLEGKTATVITSIPKDGFGEVIIEMNAGNISKAAKSDENVPIAQNETVLVLDATDSFVTVVPYEPFLK
ncbi:hypothetical protein [Listeria booriae]|uniref:hypothetical protein n=1 Tax=Listeria booriae TaxID=1552123 RepID=UPI001627C602|nr:hypothetical protein [Listeria booriae]MBC1503775.1 hypothetical protein [Listeria booriae]